MNVEVHLLTYVNLFFVLSIDGMAFKLGRPRLNSGTNVALRGRWNSTGRRDNSDIWLSKDREGKCKPCLLSIAESLSTNSRKRSH